MAEPLPPIYDYWPYQGRPEIVWPNGARLAFWVAPNIEFYEYEPAKHPSKVPWPRPVPDTWNYSWRDYGNRVGVWRMMEVMDRYGVRGSVSTSVAVIDQHPEIIQACLERDWEIFSHGIYNTRYTLDMTEDEERRIIEDSLEAILRATGRPCAGWLAPALTPTVNTANLLAEYGVLYWCDCFHDDQPTPVNVRNGRLITIPYSIEMNDTIVYNTYLQTPRGYAEQLKRQFDQLYAEGAGSGTVMAIPLHPYLIGAPHRIEAFAEVLDYVTSHRDVWVTTGRDIAEYYYAHYYDAAVADIQRRGGR